MFGFTIKLFVIKRFAIKVCTIKLSRNAKAESGEFFTNTEAEFFVKTKAESNCQKQDVMEFDSKKKAARSQIKPGKPRPRRGRGRRKKNRRAWPG